MSSIPTPRAYVCLLPLMSGLIPLCGCNTLQVETKGLGRTEVCGVRVLARLPTIPEHYPVVVVSRAEGAEAIARPPMLVRVGETARVCLDHSDLGSCASAPSGEPEEVIMCHISLQITNHVPFGLTSPGPYLAVSTRTVLERHGTNVWSETKCFVQSSLGEMEELHPSGLGVDQ